MAEISEIPNGAGEGNRTLVFSLGRLTRSARIAGNPLSEEFSMREQLANESGIGKAVTAVLPQRYSALDLALMDEAEREFWLRYWGPNPPTQAAIDQAWRQWHSRAKGKRVYFIQRGIDGPIKIGVAKRPSRRVAELQTGSAEPLIPLATCLGDRAMERDYHQRFAQHRIGGEWFRPVAAIMDEIARLRARKHLGSTR